MTPERLEELAAAADARALWRLGADEQMALVGADRAALDVGVALRRYAFHVRELRALLGTGRSLLITQLSTNGTAVMTVKTPAAHARLVEARAVAWQKETIDACTDPDNCRRCKAPKWDRARHFHAGIPL